MEHGVVIAVLFLFLVAATNLVVSRVTLPAPVVQTLAGMALAFVPGFPAIRLNADLVLLGVLPPLVYAAAVKLPWQDFVDTIRPITTLAFGLVMATVAAVALVAHSIIPGFSWAAAVALGAIVSPTDTVASTALASRAGVPHRLVAILEGEGLVNDAIALTVKTLAVAALTGHTVAVSTGVLTFIVIVVGEVAYGWALGWVMARVRSHIEDANTETLITLITPFAAYLVPALLGGSGVLATVATGMYIGERSAEIVPSGTRLRLSSVWDVIVFALNGSLFLLTGLQVRFIWRGTGTARTCILALAIAATAIILRACWTAVAFWLRKRLASARDREAMPPPRHVVFLAFSGMRGAISLAAALSIPASVESRSLIVFITACVIAVTLLVQGTTLPWLIRRLRLDRDAAAETRTTLEQEMEARGASAVAAMDALQGEDNPIAARVRKDYELILHAGDEGNPKREMRLEAAIRRKAIAAQRKRLLELHRRARINDVVLRRMFRDLDLQEVTVENRLSDPD